jgi:hypothetical protein
MKNKIYHLFIICVLLNNLSSKAQVPNMLGLTGATNVCATIFSNTYTALASNSPTSYTWVATPSLGVVFSSVNSSTTTLLFPQSNSIYTVYCIASNTAGVAANSANIVIQVNEMPIPTISGTFTYCSNSSALLSATAPTTSASPALSYVW